MSHPESFSPLLTYANPLLISDHWEARVEMLIAQILKLQTSLFLVFVSSQRNIHGLQTQVCMEHTYTKD